MKANEAPEKLYISPTAFEIGEKINHILTAKIEGDIEYTRTDAFIEKAATWIANRYQANGSYLCADDIDDFIKYMKGE